MERSVQIAQLKSRLSEYLREVRAGHPIVVMDRRTPIAHILPYDEATPGLVIREPKDGAPLFRDIPMPPPIDLRGRGIDLMKILEEEREDRDLLG